MPPRTLPVRRTSTHCTTGSLPITVHARRVFPMAPVSEYAVLDFRDRIFTAPLRRRLLAFARTLAVHVALRVQPLSCSSIPLPSPLPPGPSRRPPCLGLDQCPLVPALAVLDGEKARELAADHEEQQHADDNQDDAFQGSWFREGILARAIFA